jgi:signal transduction histidine kinase
MTDNSLARPGGPNTELSDPEATHKAFDRPGDEADELRASRERIVRAEDHERRRLERDLHDGPQQDLIALAVNLQLARELVVRDADAAAELLDDMGGEVQRALERTAQLAQRIYPPLLETGGLPAALRAAAVTLGVRTEIVVTVTELPPATAAAFYFCSLDALQEIRDGGPVTITIVDDDGVVTFELRGPAQALPDEVLTRMRDRVEAIGGRLTSDPSPGGWAAVGRLPLPG